MAAISSIAGLLDHFWKQQPALLYACAILIGCFAGFDCSWLLLFPILTIWGISLPFLLVSGLRSFFRRYQTLWVRLGFAFFLMAAAYGYVASHYQLPNLSSQNIPGAAHLQIHSLSVTTTHFGKFWTYRGILRDFKPDASVQNDSKNGRNIPFRLCLPVASPLQRPKADRDYFVHGKLKEASSGTYSFQVQKEELWHPIKNTWSLAEWRFHAKKQVKSYIQHHYKDQRSAVFLAGIATGDFE